MFRIRPIRNLVPTRLDGGGSEAFVGLEDGPLRSLPSDFGDEACADFEAFPGCFGAFGVC